MPSSAARLNNLPPYVFAVLGERLREMQVQGVDVIRLDIGSPDMPPPQAVMDILSQSAHQSDKHGYSGYRGIPEFRQAVARHYQRRFGVEIDPETQVLPLLGSKEGIVNLSLAYLDSDSLALIPDIAYPSYAQAARMAESKICYMPVRAADGYLPDFSAIEADTAQRARLLWINYPNNPTGAITDVAFYQQAVDFCREHDILLASDNPYVDVTFEGYVAPSVLQVPGAAEQVVEFMSLSKSHNMAGWRLGAAVGSPSALKNLLQIKSNMDSGHFKAIYDAGAYALDHTSNAWMNERNSAYQQRRDRILAALPEIGLEAQKPMASLYIWAKPKTLAAQDYVEQALMDAHVSLAPGGAYGPGGDDYIRISLGIPDTRLNEALERLTHWYTTNA